MNIPVMSFSTYTDRNDNNDDGGGEKWVLARRWYQKFFLLPPGWIRIRIGEGLQGASKAASDGQLQQECGETQIQRGESKDPNGGGGGEGCDAMRRKGERKRV